ncbi:Positive regulator of purine utilization [Pleurostoma richardsiae]|uniref:Positive regulator of purine utilization n=1 Tax=Pleurostoma richardsiae TaxID=41990 RepID=A0AA38RQ41_9PEZI|nr:Positive regulator of purine utilization [Pleurostoma richardsiae]
MSSLRTSGKPSSPHRVSRTACIRCRQKKKRCDQQLPKCRLCALAGVECLGYDAVAKRQVPRSYTRSLEERVAHLEGSLQAYRARDKASEAALWVAPSSTARRSDLASPTIPSTESPVSLEHDSDPAIAARATAEEVSKLTRQPSGQEPPFFKIVLGEIMKLGMSPKTRLHRQSFEKQHASGIVGDLDANPISLPSKETAQNLVNAYFQRTGMTMPLLHEPTFQQKLELLYSMPQTINLTNTHTAADARIAVFFVLEVFAVALLLLQKQDPPRVPTWLADRYHKTAVMALSEVGVPHDIEGVQALLLVGQYSHYHPTAWNAWKIDTMRRVFWVAYSMDRNLSTTMCLPSCLSDGAISTNFPSEVDDRYITSDPRLATDGPVSAHKHINLHYCRYRKIQSEMQTVLFQAPSPPYQPIDLERWQQEMQGRLEAWYKDSPLAENLSSLEKGVTETFEVNYHNAVFYLYRPCPNIPTPSSPQLVAMTQAATNMIRLYRQFFREHKLNIYWQAVENLYSAGTALMYAYGHSSKVRELLTFRSLESLVHTCSSALWGMVERFPAFKGRRDAFDLAASRILADLGTSFATSGEAPALPWTAYDGNLRQSQLGLALPPTASDGGLDDCGRVDDLSFPDFDDLSLVWEAAVGVNGNLDPAWL